MTQPITPGTTRPIPDLRTSLAQSRLAHLAGSLRQGLPGDGRPTSRREAAVRCPHRVRRFLMNAAPRHRFIGGTWTEPVGEHVCIGGWQL